MPDGTADHIVKDANRKLLLLAGYCVHIPDKTIRRKAGEIIEEIQDADIPNLKAIIDKCP